MHAAPMHADDLQSHIADLTPRERQVMDYVALGAPNKAIARALSLSLRTVEYYRANLFRKLQVGNAVELMRFLHGDTHRQGWRAYLAEQHENGHQKISRPACAPPASSAYNNRRLT